MNFSDILLNRKDSLHIVLDEYKLYLDESLPSAMIRGEVIVNFPKDTFIQGPIEVIFEGIQRFLPWREIMKYRALGDPIETKIQVIELSLLPPNSNGLMPAGIQRFPFEFPIPTNLPATISIKDRIDIFYQISAILRRSNQNSVDQYSSEGVNWFDRVRKVGIKKKCIARESIRIVRSIESVVARNVIRSVTSSGVVDMVFRGNNTETSDILSMISPTVNELDSSNIISTQNELQVNPSLWNLRNLDYYQGSLDEQHDNLAFSLAGRSSDNLSSPTNALDIVQGIRYKLEIDRTAIVLGTSVGIGLMIAPTLADVKICSVILKVSENCKYSMKIPGNHSWDTKAPETRRDSEKTTMVLKWAYGYQIENKDGEPQEGDRTAGLDIKTPYNGSKYVYKICDGDLNSVCSGSLKYGPINEKECLKGNPTISKNTGESGSIEDDYNENTSLNKLPDTSNEISNLKELNQEVKLGEYFGGRFVLPVPGCDTLLHPSMVYDSLTINHWSNIVVTLECNNKRFDINLESPIHLLNCRLVATGDECQTILPPPPSYDPSEENHCKYTSLSSSIWEQREKITSETNWGCCIPCPCEYKKLLKEKKIKKLPSKNSMSQGLSTSTSHPSNLSPEWGPPPMYTS